MAALFTLEAINKNWLPLSRGQFEAILGGVCEFYLDRLKAPTVTKDVEQIHAAFIHDYWPDRQPLLKGDDTDLFEFSKYPHDERAEFLRAMEAFYADFQRDQMDPRLSWMRERRTNFNAAFEEVIALMRVEIAATS